MYLQTKTITDSYKKNLADRTILQEGKARPEIKTFLGTSANAVLT